MPGSFSLSPWGRAALGLLLAFILLVGLPNWAAAQGEGEPAPAPAAAAPKAEAGGASDNIIIHIIKSVGIFWLILLPTSLWLVALIVLLLLDLRGGAAIPGGFVEEFTEIVNKRKFKEAFEMAKEDPSMLGRVMTAGMGRLQYGLEDAREAALNQLEAIKSDKDQRNNYTAVIATLGPLLGLVGTVFGMIESFMELGKGGTPNTSALASGISHALAVTLVGVAISVPAIAVNTYFRNRITQVTLDVGHVADDLLTQMYHNSKKTVAAGPTLAPMPAPTAAPPPR
jgi:biopolymer transport protein ExbB